MKAQPKACSVCNKTFWTKLDHEIRCPRCSRKLLAKRTAHVLSKPLPEPAATPIGPHIVDTELYDWVTDRLSSENP